MTRTGQQASTFVIVLSGEIDLANAQEVGDRIIATMEHDDEGKTVIVDCSGIGFIDSRGIAVLARVHSAFSRAERPLIWRGFNEQVVKVLNLLGVYDYLTIAE